jgi:sugar porter (SP) family MFS transporter
MKKIKDKFSKGSTTYLWFICLVAACGGLLFGYDVIVVSGIIPQVVNQFKLTAFQLGFLVSCVLWGSAVGSGFGGIILDAYGRKTVLIIASIILFISAMGSSIATSTTLLISTRLLGGIGCGLATITCPLYISEVSPQNHRGRMVTLYHFAVCFGIVICVFVNWAIFSFAESHVNSEAISPFWKWFAVDQNWRTMLVSEAFPALLFFVCTFLLPESPRWLIKNNRREEAKSILTKINGKNRAHQVYTEICDTVRMESRVTFFDLFTAKLFRPLLLSIFICVFSEACGISAVLYYGPQLFEQAGLSLGKSLGGFSVIAIVLLIFNLVAIHFIDTLGRRKMLAIGATGAMISLISIGSLYLAEQTGLIIVFAITAFVAFFAFSIGPVKFVILSEIFPNRIRGKAISVGVICIWLTSGAIAQLFPMMREVMHTGYIFFFFALDTAALLMVIKFLMPETKGRTIEEIERSWLLDK